MSQPALPDAEWDLVKEFYRPLDELHMEECSCCHERWLGMQLVNDCCGPCRHSKRRRLWFAPGSNLNLGAVPDHLPELNDVEEMFIARAHVHVQVRQIRDQQYQYSGHTVCFMQNTQKLYNKLPLMSKDLDIILLKPASGQESDMAAINRSFERQFRVRRRNIARWLYYLKHYHPDNNGVDTSAIVPDLRPENTGLEQLRQDLTRANPLSVPSFNRELISEFGSICVLRMVFPTLFPNGQGDTRFRYIVFNMLQRQKARSQASWICREN
jgi:hypothetical protein